MPPAMRGHLVGINRIGRPPPVRAKSLRRPRRPYMADDAQIFTRVEETVAGLRRLPQLILPEPNLKSACLFLAGYDAAFGGAPFVGLHAWLILKVDGCRDGVHWMDNLPRAARYIVATSTSPTKLLTAGCKVLEKFFAYCRRNGVRKILRRVCELASRENSGREHQR
jgi:hypothetical protein